MNDYRFDVHIKNHAKTNQRLCHYEQKNLLMTLYDNINKQKFVFKVS